ncbi:tail fiber assembly protein [Burkholderia sp. IMCC1007]|uniref:tail fiber assembly protein n=1 Tax=Burkholderia sp. IMCC1007 TaxID=3004104 RepID=UPI0022B424D8|nr:tail fiber assembly protein [Burkholderia sp. IMCC1007]
MNTNLMHQFDNESGQYVSSFMPDADPMNPNRWLTPAFCTSDPLPDRGPREWPFRRGDSWVLLPDFRGVVLYRTSDGSPAEISIAGVAPNEAGLTDAPRPSTEYVWNGGQWTVDPALLAQRVHDEAMAEFERRMAIARQANAGKADAYAADLLSREECDKFRAWSAYQLDLVRTIQAKDFPLNVRWPSQPA